jgi:MarR family transcriptional regulator, transcriptional regulator for hemolysin
VILGVAVRAHGAGHVPANGMLCDDSLAYDLATTLYNGPMSNPDEHIGFMISDVARLMRTVFDRRVRRLGLTRAQWLALTRLHRRPGASQSELADMMEVEKATVGRLIDRLEAKGWVERRAQAGDRRVNRVYLTAEAERLHLRIWRIAEATVQDALGQLSRREAAQLFKLLGRVKTRLVEMADAPVSQLAAKDADLEAIGFNAEVAARHAGPKDEVVAP